ncbi:beta-ketoacyl-[acyl-carrier-protein] synthase family protein [Solihabitans fulvus]|uniref:Beta-ketoacyl-[acyl-carrier-protein] synthase family protein n=1 Tax=Solihabitans fulvus TaxID=1892852 RepID=A0A5B2XPD9_9PSEU|nr:beta-ketoacyl-[acyl-carrier-protein] synthase family protein [Solihabitans fulvus]KAA2265788.1 beta-ketoacyl-[acyl-carrier-protein] synthase family protein [Solihabitans fulvus]
MSGPDGRGTRRVAVTGLGPVSNIGTGVREFGSGLRAGLVGYSKIRSFDPTGFPHAYAGEVPDFDPGPTLRRLEAGRWGRSGQFAAVAARLAVEDAGIAIDRRDARRVAVVMGTTSGESRLVDQLAAQAVAAGGYAGFDTNELTKLPAARLANAASEELGAAGLSVTLATACSASNYAIGYGFDLVAVGAADVVIAGGADSVCRWAHAGFYRLGALSEDRCSPFDRDRTGILTAEGGVALTLEAMDRAHARGARVYAEVFGYGLNCDARHMVTPNADSIAECMRLAHANAGVKPQEIDYICAHGTGTAINDQAEAQAVRQVFGANPPPMSSIKSMLGHTMGAASGFGAVAAVLAIAEGFLPPTANWSIPDPRFDWLDPVPNQSRPATVRVAQNNGFAFGGNNCITVFGALP